VSHVQFVHRAVESLVIDAGPAEERPNPAQSGDSRALTIAPEGDDRNVVGVSERALALAVRIAGKAAGALAAEDRTAAEGSDGCVGRDRPANPPTGSRRRSLAWRPTTSRRSPTRRAVASVGYVVQSVVMA
jgi:hypothetical protein